MKSNDQSKVRATAKYMRIGPRKMRMVIPLIKSKPAVQALGILENLNKKAARILKEVLKTGIANAKVKKMDPTHLIVSDVRANGGPILKRLMTRSMGRADRILKRTSHVSVELTNVAPATQTPEKK